MVSGSNPGIIFEWFNSIVTDAPKVVATAMDETIDQGAQIMREKTDRIDTGLMYDSIDYKLVEESAEKVVGEFGFLDEQKLYFALQTVTGFHHGSSFIEPTFALRDAYEYAVKLLEAKVSDGLGKL